MVKYDRATELANDRQSVRMEVKLNNGSTQLRRRDMKLKLKPHNWGFMERGEKSLEIHLTVGMITGIWLDASGVEHPIGLPLHEIRSMHTTMSEEEAIYAMERLTSDLPFTTGEKELPGQNSKGKSLSEIYPGFPIISSSVDTGAKESTDNTTKRTKTEEK